MKIYNSLTKKKEEFEPVKRGTANIYTCGVTVYDDCHIGHARSLYIFDVVRRYLEYKGYKVNFVRNITDIDDKIINRANELKTPWRELVDRYIENYKKDLKGLNVREGLPDKDGEEPRATKNIPDMIDYIEALVDKGYAYEAGGDVYFDVRKFPGYGRLSGQDIEKLREGARISPDGKKRDALDFALWKKSKENEPWWHSPWSKGRPGWHIECSVMSQKFLNVETLDIHAGGRDLIFPHHENEIAQAEAKTGKPFAKYWLHHGLLTIDRQKMSKSLNNFVTIKDALEKYPADALKLFYLQAHYSSSVDFSEKKMREAKAALERFNIFFDKTEKESKGGNKSEKYTDEFKKEIDLLSCEFAQAMDDDFNTAQALAKLFEMVNKANPDLGGNYANAEYARDVIMDLASRVFGIFLSAEEIAPEKKDFIESKIAERDTARQNRDFKNSDRIRDELKREGIIIEDTNNGTIWRKA